MKIFDFKWDFHSDLRWCQKGTKTDKTSEFTLLNADSEVYPQSSMPESVNIKFNEIFWRILIKANIVEAFKFAKFAKFARSFLKHWRQIQVLLRKLIWLHKTFSPNQSQFRKTENLSLFPSRVMSESILFPKHLHFILLQYDHTFHLMLRAPQNSPYYLPPQAENVARCGRKTWS